MIYQEGQVDYYGKIFISLLGFMEIRRKVDVDVSGFEYSLVNYVSKGYSGQDQVQVAAVIQLPVDTVQYRYTAAENVIIQSDNARGFASQEVIQFIFNMNTRLDNEKMLC